MRLNLITCLVLLYGIASGQPISPDEVFTKYQIKKINTAETLRSVKASYRSNANILIDKWELNLVESNILSPNYVSMDQDGNILSSENSRPIPMNGYTKDGGRVSLTIGDDFIYGFINEGNETFYIEPARYYKETEEKNEFIIYNVKDIKPTSPKTCGFTELNNKKEERRRNTSRNAAGLCYEIEYAICNDWSMVQKYGSVNAAEFHAIGVTNDVNTSYDDEFSDELRFVITGQVTSTCSSCDPWSSSTDIGDVLDSFTAWAPNNLSIPHDVASLWSSRDFNGGVIGLAWLNQVCKAFKYNVLEDFNTNANLKRVLVAHEIGHNLGSGHDEGTTIYIMSPSVSNTVVWTGASVSAIENYLATVSCLSICTGPVPQINFSEEFSSVVESGGSGVGGPCSEPYIDIVKAVVMTKSPESNVVVGISIDNLSTADSNYDYQLMTSSVTFTPTGSLSQNVTIRVYDDKIEEIGETVVLNLNINSGTADLGPFDQHQLTITSEGDNATSFSVDYLHGSSPYYSLQAIFNGGSYDSKSRILLTAAQLQSSGLVAGNLEGLSLYISIKNSTSTFNNFRIGIKDVSASGLSGTPWYSTSQVHMGDVVTSEGWNYFSFSNNYYWDGTSNLYIDFCFDNSSSIGADYIAYFSVGSGSQESLSFRNSNTTSGCSLNSGSYSYYPDIHPAILFRMASSVIVETASNQSSSGRLRSGETAYFYSGNSKIIMSIKNIGSTDMECVDTYITTAGSSKSNLSFGGYEFSNKTFQVDADNDAIYELTLYFTDSELNVWGTEKLKLNIIQADVPISNSTENNSSFIYSKEVLSNAGEGNDISYKAVMNGGGYFALTNGNDAVTSGMLDNSNLGITELGKGILMRNNSNVQYLVKVDGNGNITATPSGATAFGSNLSSHDLYINTASRGIVIRRNSSSYSHLTIDNNGQITSSSMSTMPSNTMSVPTGHFKLDICAGIIMTNAQGECWKLYIDEAGSICTAEIPCP